MGIPHLGGTSSTKIKCFGAHLKSYTTKLYPAPPTEGGDEDPHAPVTVTIPFHLPVDLNDCEVGKLVAVHVRPSWYRQPETVADGDAPIFWIAKITGFDRVHDKLILSYYARSVRNPLYFIYAPQFSGSIPVSAVLAYGFMLCSNRKLRAVTYRAIARVLELGIDN